MTDWFVGVDWEKNGHFEDLWPDVIQMEWRLGMGKAHQRVADESTCQIWLRNVGGMYNPELAENVLPHRRMEIRADGELMWRGWLHQILPQWERAAAQTGQSTLILKALGAKQLLQEAEVNLPLQQNKRADQIIGEVLRRVVLPPASSGGWILGRLGFSELGISTRLAQQSDYADLETGVLVFPYYGETRTAERNVNGYQIIKEVTEAERGLFFFGRDGKAVWWNRNRLLDDCADDGLIQTDGELRPIELDYRFGASLANRVQVLVYPRKAGASITLWELDKPISIPLGDSIQFEALFTDEFDQPSGALSVTPTALSFASGSASVKVNLQAERALVTLSNTGASDALLTGMRLEGQVLSSRNRVVIRQEDRESIRDYGRRGEIKLNLKALEDYAEALDIATLELARRKDPRGEVWRVRLLNLEEQLAWQIGDRIRVKAPELGHDLPYVILGEQHQVSAGGKVHQTDFILEALVLTRLAYHPKSAQNAAVKLKHPEKNYTRLAQSFTVTVDSALRSVRLWLRKEGNPTGDLWLKICANQPQGGTWRLGVVGSSELGTQTRLAADSDYPQSVALGTSENVAASTVGSGFGWVEFHWVDFPPVEAGMTYWLVLEASDAESGVQWGAESGAAGMLAEKGGSWRRIFSQAIFEVYQAV